MNDEFETHNLFLRKKKYLKNCKIFVKLADKSFSKDLERI